MSIVSIISIFHSFFLIPNIFLNMFMSILLYLVLPICLILSTITMFSFDFHWILLELTNLLSVYLTAYIV